MAFWRFTGASDEFFPSLGLTARPGEVYDFGDEPTDRTEGYGSMQIHNHDAKQTLFAINNWRAGEKADIGMGNQGQGNPDWTFAANAATYKSKRLRVLVRAK